MKKKRGRVRWSEVRACECEREHLHSATWDNFINLLSILNNRFWRSANLLYNVHNPYPLADNPPPPHSDLANPSFGSGLAQPLKLSHRDKSSHPLALCALLCCITVFSEGDAGGGSTTYLQQSHSFIPPFSLALPSPPWPKILAAHFIA